MAEMPFFILGRYFEKNQYKQSYDLYSRINRSELEGLNIAEGKIYVIGHCVPDADSVCSAIAYANLFKKVGYDALPVVAGKVNNETKFI